MNESEENVSNKETNSLQPQEITSSPCKKRKKIADISRYTVVVDHKKDWLWQIEGLQVLSANEYLIQDKHENKHSLRVANLCRRYSYLSSGYYCSLLAEARGDLPMPTVADILDLSRRSLYAFALPELEALINHVFSKALEAEENYFELFIFFGQTENKRLQKVGRKVFDIFRYPLLKVSLKKEKKWSIVRISPLGIHKIPMHMSDFFEQSIREYTRVPLRKKPVRKTSIYDLAILVNPNEKLPPSDDKAIERFIKAGKSLRLDCEIIYASDFHRISEFDALFIRETTVLDNHTFRFARKAEEEGLPVIDDSRSILRCTNKVFLWEKLKKYRLPTPLTVALNRADFFEHSIKALESTLGYPMVLKIPDGSFSRGMIKAQNREQLVQGAKQLFGNLRLLLAQEFMYTAYDWRVGILAGKPLYVCKYMVPKGHWQIILHNSDGSYKAGGFETIPVAEAPAAVVTLALKAAALIGNGLYGVDIKENKKGVYVMEINDNPSIDGGVEDKVLKGELYSSILREFIVRIEKNRET